MKQTFAGGMAVFAGVKWVFLDVGSTLVDEEAAYVHRMRDIAENAGVEFDRVWEMAVGFYKEKKKGDKETAKALGVSLTRWHGEEERLYEDAAACLATLSRKYKIGIIANQEPGTAERLKKFGILQYIDLVVASAEEGVAKPDARIFEIALERSGCRPEETVMVGDRVDNDILPAKGLGMKTVWIRQGFWQYWAVAEERERADAVVESLTELCGIL